MRMNQSLSLEKPTASPAHLGWRLMALLYDTIISIALLMLSSALMLVLNHGAPATPGSWYAFVFFLFTWAVLGAYAICSWRLGGQTLGMRPWRLKILTSQGTQPSWGALCVRYGIASMTLGLGALWSVFDSQHRALYDIASGTVFVRLQPTKSV